jgi:hypothetical protein
MVFMMVSFAEKLVSHIDGCASMPMPGPFPFHPARIPTGAMLSARSFCVIGPSVLERTFGQPES